MSAESPRILFLSHSHTFGPFRVGSHHYARLLARTGADVVHLSTPVSLAHRVTGRVDRRVVKALPRRAKTDADGVTHVVPRTVLPAPFGRFSVRRELDRAGIDTHFDAVLIDQPLLWDDAVRTLADTLVYRPTDLYPDGRKHELQRRILAAADGVIATSNEVLRALGPLAVPSIVIENGVDAERFLTTATDTAERPPVCVYVGALDARFDADQVVAWAETHPDVQFIVVGPGRVARELPTNVDMPGAVAYDSLPALLASARVGLLPLSDDPSNAGRSPMKLYEYLAAGLTVVTRRTPVLTGDDAAGIFTYTSAADAQAALDRALARPSPNRVGREISAAHVWEAKATRLLTFVDDLDDA